ncbi:MAG: Class SAM-dependent methyltransferase [Verrucomicrobiota bacterium]|nr:Class SAM-dependent methyltransferase [Verrucomicrobiota bacterium]
MTLDYSRFYARYHPEDAAHRNGLRLLHHRMLAPWLPEDRNAPILDVGCGRGYALQDLAALGYKNLQGIDTDVNQAAFARSQHLDVVHVESTESFLATQTGAYAVILLMDVLEHVPRESQPAFLQAVARSLRPGGRLICTVPNAASAIASYWLHNDYTHHLSFTADSLTGLIEQCGFATTRCTAIEFSLRPRFLFWLPTPRAIVWWLRCLLRLRQRAAFVAELGWTRGGQVILTPNLLAVADRDG